MARRANSHLIGFAAGDGAPWVITAIRNQATATSSRADFFTEYIRVSAACRMVCESGAVVRVGRDAEAGGDLQLQSATL